MTLQLKTNFLEYFDFFNIAVDAYKNSQNFISKKILNTLSSQLHNKYIELEKISIEIKKLDIMEGGLDNFYDTFLDSIDNIKLLKNKLNKLDNKEFEFVNLYNEADQLHNSIIRLMDEITSLEINQIRDNVAA